MPDPEGHACGDGIFGWQTACEVHGTISYENPLAPGQYLELEPFVDSGFACCEGKAAEATADAACVHSCREQLCNIADNIYDQIAQENGWNCALGCRFDFEGCMAGIPVQQFPHPPQGDDYPHEVMVTCEATSIAPRNPDGTFAFVELPTNFSVNDPAPCGQAPAAAGVPPLRPLLANTVREDAGTRALATWWVGDDVGRQGTGEVEATLGYAIRPCGDDECLELTRLHASIPAGTYAGLTVQSASLSLIGVSEAPVIDRSGTFSFPAGSLHFVLNATVADVPLAITRTNAVAARGRVSHTADLFELTELQLTHEDAGLWAELRLEIVASHTNRAPRAAIRRIHTPLDCDEPVVLQAASMDPDDDPMQHYWWTPLGMFHAPAAELALPSGTHFVVLVSADPRGAYDATSLTFKRSCS